jgi:hypothetical protein
MDTLAVQETRLALTSNRELTPQIWTMIKEMAPVMHQARLFGVTSSEQAAAIMLKGYELGLGITASFEFIQVIQGKPGLIPRGALALLHTSPEMEKIEIRRLMNGNTFIGFECYMKRRGGFEHTSRWTMDDAKRAGLIKPDSGWVNYPENMCMWRAIGFTADVVAPDITAGMTALMKMPEQYGVALSEGGDVIDVTSAPAPAHVAPTAPAITLDDLCNMFGAEAVLVANEGKIPGSDAEVQALAVKLAGGA